MAVKIRLARGGAKKRPYYRIVVADERMPRDGRYIERVGSYNPMLPKGDENRVQLVTERVKYWLGQGAQPTRRVEMFLADAKLGEKKTYNNPQKAEQSEKTKMRLEEKAEKQQAANNRILFFERFSKAHGLAAMKMMEYGAKIKEQRKKEEDAMFGGG